MRHVRRASGSVVGWSTELFHVGPMLLGRQASLLRASAGCGGPSCRRGRAERVGDDGREPLPCGIPVATLLAIFGCRDRQHASHQSAAQVREESLPLMRREGGRSCGIPDEFRSGIGSVHTLPARARGTREPPRQLGLGDGDPGVDAQSGAMGGRHESIMPLLRSPDPHASWSHSTASGSPERSSRSLAASISPATGPYVASASS